ncbi:MAG: pyruvate kinase [Planctomycetota bacterium]|nr:pyruvate kinase [Planctomycetota bacterium]
MDAIAALRGPPWTPEALLQAVRGLADACAAMEQLHAPAIQGLSDEHRLSAANLLHYLSLRTSDLRDIQIALAELGLSSLGRSESCVLANLHAIARALSLMSDGNLADPSFRIERDRTAVSMRRAAELLETRTTALLGPAPRTGARIMVTLPDDAGDDPALVRELVHAGMTCARINTAHGDEAAWQRMASNVREAARDAGVLCKVLVDLAGPKIRTGSFPDGPRVVKVQPERDDLGRVLVPGQVRFVAIGREQAPPARFQAVGASPAAAPPRTPAGFRTPVVPRVPVEQSWLSRLRPGVRIACVDARGAERSFTVTSVDDDGALALGPATAYLVSGTRFLASDASDRFQTSMADVLPLPGFVILGMGDRFVLTTETAAIDPAQGADRADSARKLPVVRCTLMEAIRALRPGDPVFFDDGKLAGVVEDFVPQGVIVRVVAAPERGLRLRADKGINFPQTRLDLPAITDDDVRCLGFIARHADLVGMSFVREVDDVQRLHAELARVGGQHLGLVLKIETKRAFENLPALLLAGLRSPAVGVMIARGDLAVECGYERLAEVQEEILWLCEAAHLPVIWATQVLESLAKKGQPSRAEVTDAAMSERAECVMLNKGPFVADAVKFLRGVLARMQHHQSKKRHMLRALEVARSFGAPG